MKQVEVVAAIIVNDNKVLCVQRGENKYEYISKKFEFPGGKIESGETREDTIVREIMEELDLKIQIQKEFITINHNYPDFTLIMHSFICNCENTNLYLKEHISFEWLPLNELNKLDWAGADVPIVENLMRTSL
jgi:8-oxo-dGTP diphosphatase